MSFSQMVVKGLIAQELQFENIKVVQENNMNHCIKVTYNWNWFTFAHTTCAMHYTKPLIFFFKIQN